MAAAPPAAATVPRCWPDAQVVILGAGPSLTPSDVDACRGRARVIAIKDSIRLAPWADVLYACDRRWWLAHPETARFTGPKYGLEAVPGRPDITVLKHTGEMGFEDDPGGLRSGRNSGYQAINLAVHLGASRIVLLGYDMKPDAHGKVRWFGQHSYGGPTMPAFDHFLRFMPMLVEPLRLRGVSVINATRDTAIQCFPLANLDLALAAPRITAPGVV